MQVEEMVLRIWLVAMRRNQDKDVSLCALYKFTGSSKKYRTQKRQCWGRNRTKSWKSGYPYYMVEQRRRYKSKRHESAESVKHHKCLCCEVRRKAKKRRNPILLQFARMLKCVY